MSYYIKRQKLKFINEQIIEVPNCKILSAGIYKGEPVLYLLMDTNDKALWKYEILMPFTEQLFVDHYCFIGSIDIKNITAHIFYRIHIPKIFIDDIENKKVATKEIKKRGRQKKYKGIEK